MTPGHITIVIHVHPLVCPVST